MKKYLAVCSFRGVQIKVIYNDTEELYTGSAEEVPYEIGQLIYSDVKMDENGTWVLYVYSEEYKKD